MTYRSTYQHFASGARARSIVQWRTLASSLQHASCVLAASPGLETTQSSIRRTPGTLFCLDNPESTKIDCGSGTRALSTSSCIKISSTTASIFPRSTFSWIAIFQSSVIALFLTKRHSKVVRICLDSSALSAIHR